MMVLLKWSGKARFDLSRSINHEGWSVLAHSHLLAQATTDRVSMERVREHRALAWSASSANAMPCGALSKVGK